MHQTVIEYVAIGLEYLGVAVIAIGVLHCFIRYLAVPKARNYKSVRQGIGKAILLGLEILVAADIVATVVTELNLKKVLTLGIVVLIRTVLSFSLQIELDGTLPWKKKSGV